MNTQFPNGPLVGCSFHFKQALRRNLLSRGIPQNLVTALIGPGGWIEVLMVIPIEEIRTKGIPYVRSKMPVGVYHVKFNQF